MPAIPAKRYFTIGEVSELCGVKPHVLRYWEQEFVQLKPMKRRGNRRYYQHHEVLLIRRIRELLYEQGFTISGARNRLAESSTNGRGPHAAGAQEGPWPTPVLPPVMSPEGGAAPQLDRERPGRHVEPASAEEADVDWTQLRRELLAIRELLAEV